MAKVKDLNFLLEFGQKNLQSAMVSTVERYRKQLYSLICDYFLESTPGPELTELRRYQSGVREIIVKLKKKKEGTATSEDLEFDGPIPKYGISGSSTHVGCYQKISLKDKELVGKTLAWYESKKVHLVDGFDYCVVCGHIYAISSEKSRFCSKLCRGNYQRQKAE